MTVTPIRRALPVIPGTVSIARFRRSGISNPV
jgi:hypothetical protein